jgi:tetratricopeptide (TPR) repeat protein
MSQRAQPFKKSLSRILRLWEREDFDAALSEVDALLQEWRGNSQLQIWRASLIQLQDSPSQTLEAAKQALQQAVDLDPSSPAASIELGHYLDSVEDNPKAAAKAFSKAIMEARRLLIEGLIGQARALLQLDRKEEVLKSLAELLDLAAATEAKRPRRVNGPDIITRSPNGRIAMLEMKGPYGEQIKQLVNEALATD